MNEDQRVILITGASRGIGRAIALHLAGPGTVLLLNHYDPEPVMAEQTCGRWRLKGPGEKFVISVWPISRRRSPKLMVSKGMGTDRYIDQQRRDYQGFFVDAHEGRRLGPGHGHYLKGAFNCTQAVIRSMIKNKSGKIVNIVSVSGVMGNAGQTNYAASKAGLIGFTKSLAKEVAARGIQVNAVAPGFIETEMTAALLEQVRQEFVKLIPMGRSGVLRGGRISGLPGFIGF